MGPPEVASRFPRAARRARRRRIQRVGVGIALALLLAGSAWEGLRMFGMPGRSHSGPLSPLTSEQVALRDHLRRDVVHLAEEIGERNMGHVSGLRRTEEFLQAELSAAGYGVDVHEVEVSGIPVRNLAAERPGSGPEAGILLLGAHYDSVVGCPGANDNGTGVAATLALARAFATSTFPRTLRFVFFVNEEPPWFQTPRMGSVPYAARCRERGERIVGMMSLETLGCYTDAPGSQRHPFPLGLVYPSEGNFVAFVGNRASRGFVRDAVGAFRRRAAFPSEGAAVPGFVSAAGWSDHWSFWKVGYPALMVTDTAPFRYAAYHTKDDTPERIDFERFARVVDGLRLVVEELAAGS